ncbi:glycoside hydrolase [Panus rudis PR-1116 ss-1]|nr:glycoside hydrolase [Panus rudis PR-1116 ss-1]
MANNGYLNVDEAAASGASTPSISPSLLAHVDADLPAPASSNVGERTSYVDPPGTPTPQQQEVTPFLAPPGLPFLDSPASTPRGSTAYPDSFGAAGSNTNLNAGYGEKESYASPSPLGKDEDEGPEVARKPWYKRPLVWALAAVSIVVLILAIVLPVYFAVVKPNKNSSSPSGASSSNGNEGNHTTSGNGDNNNSGGAKNNIVITGGDGSTVTKDDGSTFVYRNQFGGFWVSDPENPFNDNAQPNSWTPPLNTTWKWGEQRVFGVNLGGLFVLEPFISPSLYQPFGTRASDEWTLSTLLDDKLQETLENHYATFITEEDIAEIAGAGLNWIRLPVPFWAIETWKDVGADADGTKVSEPFLEGVAWKYILRVIQWCRKYGIRVNLDLHVVPGSQNGYNHSGRGGQINFLNGPMGIANAQRALDYIRAYTEFFSQPEYANVVQMFGIVNEALVNTIGRNQIQSFYLQAYKMIREITGVGEGKGPYMSIHEGFTGASSWAGFMKGADRLALDVHPYFAFSGAPNDEPVNVPADGGNGKLLGGKWPLQACNAWSSSMNTSRTAFGVTVGGEFSNAINDCGLFVNGVTNSHRSAADCDFFSDHTQWDQKTKDGLKTFAMASMDALGDFFFWTWKIGNSTAGRVEAPLWSYKLGLENGWMPTDPREAIGVCASLGVRATNAFDGAYAPWQTGGAGADKIAASVTANYDTWPPASINNADAPAAQLPMYTSTRSPVTLPPITLSPTAVSAGTATVTVTPTATGGNGWANSADTASMVTPVSGCSYPDAWRALDLPAPTACA